MAYPSLLLIHGAANAAWVWDFWRAQLRALGWEANVLDLRGHGRSLPVDYNTLTMEDYLSDVESVTTQIEAAHGRHPVVGGWSMGGLIAMMYGAAHPETPALLLFSPSQPFEVAGRADPDFIRSIPTEAIGPEHYGVYPDDLEASRAVMPDLTNEEARRVVEQSRGALESGFARRQRYRGMHVAAGAVSCPSLVVYGENEQRPSEENRRMAVYLGGESLEVRGASHWGIVCSGRAVEETAPGVDEWLRRSLTA